MFLDPRRAVFTFFSWLDLLGFVLAFWTFIQKIFKSLQTECLWLWGPTVG